MILLRQIHEIILFLVNCIARFDVIPWHISFNIDDLLCSNAERRSYFSKDNRDGNACVYMRFSWLFINSS